MTAGRAMSRNGHVGNRDRGPGRTGHRKRRTAAAMKWFDPAGARRRLSAGTARRSSVNRRRSRGLAGAASVAARYRRDMRSHRRGRSAAKACPREPATERLRSREVQPEQGLPVTDRERPGSSRLRNVTAASFSGAAAPPKTSGELDESRAARAGLRAWLRAGCSSCCATAPPRTESSVSTAATVTPSSLRDLLVGLSLKLPEDQPPPLFAREWSEPRGNSPERDCGGLRSGDAMTVLQCVEVLCRLDAAASPPAD